MHHDPEQAADCLTRRELLHAGAAGLATLALGAKARGQGVTRFPRGNYSGFRMGIQSYSLRNYGFQEALERTQALGLAYWEAFPAHVPQTDDPSKIAAMLAALKHHRVMLRAWGVVGFDGDEARARQVFQFARAMGIETISADPAPESLPVLDRLLNEYKTIRVAIHNHGPGARYDKLESVTDALRGHHDRLGACVDTGHTLRSGQDPVDWIRAIGRRVYGVHLKDVKNRTVFTELGMGDLRTADVFRELRRLRYSGIVALEYEENPENPIPGIDVSLGAARDAAAKAVNRRHYP